MTAMAKRETTVALSGSLKDFGIADIFQLISHQSKTGVLYLRTRGEEVRVFFDKGNVVRAESSARKQKDLLGNLLVRAEVITQEQLEQALETQKRTLKKLGHILCEQGFVTIEVLREFTRLQTTETIYSLFAWESGSYSFEVEEVDFDKDTIEPIRSENILMEGFRMVDEWPMVRKRLPSYDITFTKLKPLPERKTAGGLEDEVDAAFDGLTESSGKEGEDHGLSDADYRVYQLVVPERNVQKIIDLSRLGEFETCKSLVNLLEKQYIKIDKLKKEAVRQKGQTRRRVFSPLRLLVQAVVYAVIIGLAYWIYLSLDAASWFGEEGVGKMRDPAAAELLDLSLRQKLECALEVYRLENGDYPEQLDQLAAAGLIKELQLRFPWRDKRFYQRKNGHFQLLRPFH